MPSTTTSQNLATSRTGHPSHGRLGNTPAYFLGRPAAFWRRMMNTCPQGTCRPAAECAEVSARRV
jgi:hypothetical protein